MWYGSHQLWQKMFCVVCCWFCRHNKNVFVIVVFEIWCFWLEFGVMLLMSVISVVFTTGVGDKIITVDVSGKEHSRVSKAVVHHKVLVEGDD